MPFSGGTARSPLRGGELLAPIVNLTQAKCKLSAPCPPVQTEIKKRKENGEIFMNNTHSSRARSTVLPLVLTALFAALTAIGAFLRIPAGEISFTLQVFFTSMAGILLGPWWGAASQVVYVLLGLIGLPIFTEGGGLMYLAKPSCGFLLGLPLMAMVIGLLTRDLKASTLRGHAVRGMLRIALACVAGLAVLYLIGLPYMYFVLAGKWSIQKTIVSGCLIFLPFDALKIVVTTLLCVRLLPVLRRD